MSRRPLPPAGRLHLWVLRPRARAADVTAYAAHVLDDEEVHRARSFRRPRDRRQYVAAHLTLRHLLSGYTGLPPCRVVLDRAGGPRGKPRLAGAPVPLHFSLSHSHGVIAVGVAAGPVGVDVQRVPAPRTVELCLPALHPAEREEIAAWPADERPLAFARLWTRKEAYLKALGTGLARPLHADYLGEREPPVRPRGWTVRNVPAPRGHAAAAALRAYE